MKEMGKAAQLRRQKAAPRKRREGEHHHGKGEGSTTQTGEEKQRHLQDGRGEEITTANGKGTEEAPPPEEEGETEAKQILH